MTRNLTIDLRDVLLRLGERISDDIRDEAPEASGELKESISHEVSISGPIVELTISAAPHARFVELGRKAGKFPPVDAIRKWCETKGIDSRAAFPIARSIAKNGITPKRFIRNATTRNEDLVRSEVTRIVGEKAKVDIEQMIQRIFNQR